MTLREIFAALWRRSWIILLVTVVALGVAYAAIQRIEPTYTAAGVVRANPFLTQAVLNGQVAGVTADLDPSIILTPTVLDPVATSLGIDEETLAGAVVYTAEPTDPTTTLTISATSDDPDQAVAIAEAVIQGYSDYVQQTLATVAATVQTSVNDAAGQVQALQAQVAANPTDTVAAQNLTVALTNLSSQTNRLSEVQNAGNVLTVVGPVESPISSAPDPLAILGVALLCGLLAGAGIVLIMDRFDDRLRQSDDVEELTGVPVLAELPYDRTAARRRRKNRLPASTGRQGVLAERLRSLRTSVQVLLPDGKGVVVLTSVEPGDGKTFVSSNLAVSWSRAGRKVVLVGGDMRRPELHEYFPDIAGRAGLSDLLALRSDGRRAPTQAQIEQSLTTTPFRGLRVLPPGSETDEAADLLSGPNLPRVLGFAGRIADVVVVDSPPALALADASELARSADGAVLIASIRRTRRKLLREAVETLRTNDLTVLGIVVNKSRRKLPRTYASYYMSRKPSRGDDDAAPSRRRGPEADEPVREEVPDGLSGAERRAAALALDDAEER